VPRPEDSGPSRPASAEAGVADVETEALSEEDQARLEDAAREMAAVRAQLAAAPPELVIANHAMGLYELAAIHLSTDPANLVAAQLAIDAFAALLDRCQGRLGEAEATLVDARSQIQLAFVSVSRKGAGGAAAQD